MGPRENGLDGATEVGTPVPRGVLDRLSRLMFHDGGNCTYSRARLRSIWATDSVMHMPAESVHGHHTALALDSDLGLDSVTIESLEPVHDKQSSVLGTKVVVKQSQPVTRNLSSPYGTRYQ